MTPSIVEFNLNDHHKAQETNYEEIKNAEDDEGQDPKEIENDENAPKTYKANFVRRGTLLTKQILESDDNLSFLGNNKRTASMD